MKDLTKEATLIVVALVLLTVLGVWVIHWIGDYDSFDNYAEKCEKAGGYALWTGNSQRKQVTCIKKDFVIKLEVKDDDN